MRFSSNRSIRSHILQWNEFSRNPLITLPRCSRYSNSSRPKMLRIPLHPYIWPAKRPLVSRTLRPRCQSCTLMTGLSNLSFWMYRNYILPPQWCISTVRFFGGVDQESSHLYSIIESMGTLSYDTSKRLMAMHHVYIFMDRSVTRTNFKLIARIDDVNVYAYVVGWGTLSQGWWILVK